MPSRGGHVIAIILGPNDTIHGLVKLVEQNRAGILQTECYDLFE